MEYLNWSTVIRNDWDTQYPKYLKSDEWRAKCAAVLRRSDSMCEVGDCNNVATQAHHLTYTNVGNEPIEDLRAICRVCHAEIHGKQLNPGDKPIKIEIELNADDLSVLRSYFCHRNGYIPLELFFVAADKMIDWEMVCQCEQLAQKLIAAIGGDPFEVEATDEI